ncbi:uncharacterized protein CANTADRAFT_25089 [Suhomyces tanzawaensis NRRL Y-17324]|uniref:Kinase-like protein n=1 Tax=Suhomyces tanzawaensis NRRL Y-17324 TaxID=984487 RepID=A0A1E4SM76_9ASCO|nr:uncharacterized protein CANTADRAFT_25089 [Suhomyces tanzawaensis NRRL Y-17324]ODV80629.1 hypothetical protein CANTADRAFT_25089 [Suhomyces tanzawaensis NRRL Y-17324]
MHKGVSDASLLESAKENIVPLPGGHFASKLAASVKQSSRSLLQFKDNLRKDREAFEDELRNTDELDDPLQVYVDYIQWTHTNYPQGNNSDSGLLNLLERCTSCFRDVAHYKNDPRYLKVWLEYTNYSDAPRDIFVYLARKDIGSQLALYYEEFANYLELNGKEADARNIYELGIENNARPIVRLERSFHRFKQRVEGAPSHEAVPAIRNALALKRGDAVATIDKDESTRKKPKLKVFQDESGPNQSILHSIFNGSSDSNELGTIKSRIKENSIQPKPWSGEIIKQKVPLERQSSSSGSSTKFHVYRDPSATAPQDEPKACQKTETASDGSVHTIINVPGKRTEKVWLNVDLLYPSINEEFCLEEILAMQRRSSRKRTVGSGANESNHTHTVVVPLRDEDDSTIKHDRPQSPTITMFSRMANNEVINMFNDAAQNLNSDDESVREDEVTTTNYEGFVTETIHNQPIPQLESIETPPTDKESNHSSPFVERPSTDEFPQVVNAVDLSLRAQLLSALSIPLLVYPGYNNFSDRTISKMQLFKEITNKHTKSISKGSQSAMIDFCGDEIYCLRLELGKGGYGYVYLIEMGRTGELKALKVESPASEWEFYILNQVYRRLIGQDKTISSLIVKPDSLYHFKDESYLIIDFHSQGTVLDIINHYKNKGLTLEEVLCILLTIELLKAVETLHNIGILHGDLKADNCMINFTESDELSETYSAETISTWSKKSITLIDFGRAIDLTLFPPNTHFVSNWKTDEQDCPQMNENKSWCYEADYYGLASIIHSMLFGNYIKIKKEKGSVKLENNLKRYWQLELWIPLFELLLNPYKDDSHKKSLLLELKACRVSFEDWLIQNSKSKNLRSVVLGLEHDLNMTNRTRVG